jgi:signal transduction histidine kinase
VLAALVYALMRARLSRALALERHAIERRDRFFAVAAKELDAPLVTLHEEVATLESWSAPERVAAVAQKIDLLRDCVAELARLPLPVDDTARAELDLAELVREIVGQPPFIDRGPSVILRASPAPVWADRARLTTGLRLLLWVVRREVSDGNSLVVTVWGDDEAAWLELESGGAGEVAEALEQLPAVSYGMVSPAAAPGTTLALQVANQVARVHGGRLSASARIGQGERFVLELPRSAPVRH